MEHEISMTIKVNSVTIGKTVDPMVDIHYLPNSNKLQSPVDIVFNEQYLKSLLDS